MTKTIHTTISHAACIYIRTRGTIHNFDNIKKTMPKINIIQKIMQSPPGSAHNTPRPKTTGN